MSAFVKYGLLLLVCFAYLNIGYANKIDSLKTKEEVRQFLDDNLGEKGIFCGRQMMLSQTAKIPIWLSNYFKSIDTVHVKDQAAHDKQRKEIQEQIDWGYRLFGRRDVSNGEYNLPVRFHEQRLDYTNFHFHKADIDCNGLTDMIIDDGILIAIMDMGDSVQGMLVPSLVDRHLYGFKRFISLPDGTPALVLRHDKNPEKSRAHLYENGKVSYVMDTLIETIGNKVSARIDTLYKIISGFGRLERLFGNPENPELEIYQGEYTDTVDMRLYNMEDTVVYRSYGFTQYKADFKPASISKICYYYSNFVGGVSGWEPSNGCMEINKNGRCFLRYPDYDSTFSATLENTRLKKLWSFLTAIDTRYIREIHESVAIDAGEGADFAFYFDDGTVKKIRYWCMPLSMDLGYLARTMSDISYELQWLPSEKKADFECPCKFPPYDIGRWGTED